MIFNCIKSSNFTEISDTKKPMRMEQLAKTGIMKSMKVASIVNATEYWAKRNARQEVSACSPRAQPGTALFTTILSIN